LPVGSFEVLQAWDPSDLQAQLADSSEEDVTAYVERHFML
jgi:type IV secretion system protein VirD4